MRDNELITEYVLTFANYCVNLNGGRGTQRLAKKVTKLEEELEKRGLLNDDDLARLRA